MKKSLIIGLGFALCIYTAASMAKMQEADNDNDEFKIEKVDESYDVKIKLEKKLKSKLRRGIKPSFKKLGDGKWIIGLLLERWDKPAFMIIDQDGKEIVVRENEWGKFLDDGSGYCTRKRISKAVVREGDHIVKPAIDLISGFDFEGNLKWKFETSNRWKIVGDCVAEYNAEGTWFTLKKLGAFETVWSHESDGMILFPVSDGKLFALSGKGYKEKIKVSMYDKHGVLSWEHWIPPGEVEYSDHVIGKDYFIINHIDLMDDKAPPIHTMYIYNTQNGFLWKERGSYFVATISPEENYIAMANPREDKLLLVRANNGKKLYEIDLPINLTSPELYLSRRGLVLLKSDYKEQIYLMFDKKGKQIFHAKGKKSEGFFLEEDILMFFSNGKLKTYKFDEK